jgi:TolB protein
MSNRDNPDFDIFRMNADGANVEWLTSGGANGYPQYSPDGGQLALHILRDVYVMNLTTRGLRRLTYEPSNGMYPTWDPFGRRLAFMSWRNGRTEIFTVNVDGGQEAQVVVTMPSGDAINPRWSPDGRFIAFVHLPHGGLTRAQEETPQRIVYIVELSTGRLTRISR